MKRMLKAVLIAALLVMVLSINVLATEPDQNGIYDLEAASGYTVVPDTAAGDAAELTINGGVVKNFFPEAQKISLSCSAANAADQYMVLALDDDSGVPTESNLVYIDQTTADSEGIVRFTVYPMELTDGTTYHIYVVSTSLAQEKVASFSYYQAKPAGVAQFAETTYETLETALEAAEAAGGGVVVLLESTTAEMISIKSGVTLDISGRTLTCDYLIGFNGGQVIDSSMEQTGAVKCAKNSLMLSSANTQMPVWNGEDGYFFERFDTINTLGSGSNGTYTYIFRPEFATNEREVLIGANGGAASGVAIKVLLSWDIADGTSGERTLLYKDEFVNDVYANNKAFYAWITNYENYIEKNLKVQSVVVSDFGVEIASEVKLIQ